MEHILKIDEIITMRKMGRIAKKFISSLAKMIKPGTTTKKIEDYFSHYLKKYPSLESAFLGYHGYPGLLCISVNEEIIHGIPSENKIIKEGDLVSVDIGLKYKGLFVDCAYTYCVGNPTLLGKRLIKTGIAALGAGIKRARIGNRIGDIGYVIQKIVERNNFSVIRSFVGHGIGRDLHCYPEVPNFGEKRVGPCIKEGMVLAIEPMISAGNSEVEIARDGWTAKTKDNSLSCHFEHTVAITKKGAWILTN